ncbi:unnamed protein product [Protopolystoma xenopodis]|uniref:Uncharacterized protein n=1 Tax=Protopolystoma xenopodis TaxID=117903 RepID=A0A448XA69_9PLAT|nr:unnamed protein product [Protopolystoma xenopodis]
MITSGQNRIPPEESLFYCQPGQQEACLSNTTLAVTLGSEAVRPLYEVTSNYLNHSLSDQSTELQTQTSEDGDASALMLQNKLAGCQGNSFCVFDLRESTSLGENVWKMAHRLGRLFCLGGQICEFLNKLSRHIYFALVYRSL